MILGIICFFFVMQWLSVLVGILRIDKRNHKKRLSSLKKMSITMGVPATIALTIELIFFFVGIEQSFALAIFVALDVFFAIGGTKIYEQIFCCDDTSR